MADGFASLVEPLVGTQVPESPSKASRSARAARALRGFGASDCTVELRPAATVDPAEARDWSLRALSFVGVAAVAASASLGYTQAQASTHAVAHSQARALAAVEVISGQGSNAYFPQIMVKVGGRDIPTLHPLDRVRFCQIVARDEGLAKYGKNWKDIYAVIHAETGWVARDGMGRNGRVSYGLAQLEMATAKQLSVADPSDTMQSLVATARLIKEATLWARSRNIENHDVAISVYYNLSTKARNAWDGLSTSTLPVETQRHEANSQDGRRLADRLGADRQIYEKVLGKEARMRGAAAAASAASQQNHGVPEAVLGATAGVAVPVATAVVKPSADAGGTGSPTLFGSISVRTEHLLLRAMSPENVKLMKGVEDIVRAQSRNMLAMLGSPSSPATPVGGRPPGAGPGGPVQMTVGGFAQFTEQMMTAVRSLRASVLDDAPAAAINGLQRTGRELRALFESKINRTASSDSFPTYVSAMGEHAAYYEAYASNHARLRTPEVSASVGGQANIVRLAALHGNARERVRGASDVLAAEVADLGDRKAESGGRIARMAAESFRESQRDAFDSPRG